MGLFRSSKPTSAQLRDQARNMRAAAKQARMLGHGKGAIARYEADSAAFDAEAAKAERQGR